VKYHSKGGEANMAMTITEECINCSACVEECPRGAISEGDDIFVIDAGVCTECEEEGEQACVKVCPVDCIVKAE